MTDYVDLSSLYDEPLDPSQLQFTAKPGKSCHGCMFKRQRISVCNKAVEAAKLANLPICDDDDVVYVMVRIDPRQLSITEQEP